MKLSMTDRLWLAGLRGRRPSPPDLHPEFVKWWEALVRSCGGVKTCAFREFLHRVADGRTMIPHFPDDLRGREYEFYRPPRGYGFAKLCALLPSSRLRRTAYFSAK